MQLSFSNSSIIGCLEGRNAVAELYSTSTRSLSADVWFTTATDLEENVVIMMCL